MYKIAKKIFLFFLPILMGVATWAQDTNFPGRSISLTILNNKGRPVNKIIVQSLHTGNSGITDRSGMFVFKDMTDKDTISVVLPKYGITLIPVSGMDSIVVTVRSRNLYSYVANDEHDVIVRKNRDYPSSILDVPELLRQRPYRSLVELLEMQVPGLDIKSSNAPGGATVANIRGANSFRESGPMVVLDGIEIGSINDANLSISVYEIQTIEVQRSAMEWGTRGAGGVILITSIK